MNWMKMIYWNEKGKQGIGISPFFRFPFSSDLNVSKRILTVNSFGLFFSQIIYSLMDLEYDDQELTIDANGDGSEYHHNQALDEI
jgi:hypothetical protein